MGLMRRFATPQPPALISLRLSVVILKPLNVIACLSMRLKLFSLACAILAIALLLSCRPGSGNKTRLLIYTPHGQDLLKDFATRYKQQHPEIDVQFLDMGSREILERVRVEKSRPQADVWWGASHTTFQSAADENLLLEYHPPRANKLPATTRDPSDPCYGTAETPQVIAYNSQLVTEAGAPRDWD